MNLTQKQETQIISYLDSVSAHLNHSLSETARTRGLARLEARIDLELERLDVEEITDRDIAAVLQLLGAPERQAASIGKRLDPETLVGLLGKDRIWLGVCAELARHLHLPQRYLRWGFFFAGLATGPLAICAYLCVYGYFYFQIPPKARPEINLARVVWNTLIATVIAIVMNMGVGYLLSAIYYLHEQVLKRPMPAIGEWGWIEYDAGEMLFWILALCMPLAALSGFPLANAWERSIKRIVQAMLALYAILLSWGVASFIVGIILDFLEEFGGWAELTQQIKL